MLDIITIIGFIVGIIFAKFACKNNNKTLTNISVFIILICLVYIIPVHLIDFLEFFLDGVGSIAFR